jgi:SAM-dependent MidA family methyltransferase
MNNLPLPSAEALSHSQTLKALILNRMQAGSLSFLDFMKACLYEPGLGYYAAGSRKFGEAGDFITAPLVSSLFGKTLAQATYPTIQKTSGTYLELGAGSGNMALDILEWLAAQGDETTQYYILEVSPDCRAQQAEKLASYTKRVHWLDTLPKDFRGVLLANEVLDALPVCLFHYVDGSLFERRVSSENNHFIWVDEPITDDLLLKAIQALDLPPNYLSEINPTLPMFIHSLIECMAAGELILIDYGFLRETYYHPDRNQGTLMCHYRHHAHPDPFLYPGLQDITAHVDFTAVGLAARAAGVEVALYTQAEFLLQQGLLTVFEQALAQATDVERARLSAAVQKLVQPQEMGELFKVITLQIP